jgi:hypothetical protein
MMISVNVTGGTQKDGKLIGASITGSANGKTFGVKYTEEKYNAMKAIEAKANEADSMEDLQNILADFEPFTHDGYKELIETECPNLFVNEETGKFYLQTTGGVTISSKPLPQALVDRILTSVEKKIDFLPIVKLWTRFLRNPNYADAKAAKFANYINKTIVDHKLKKELIEKNGVAPLTAVERATVFQTPVTQEGLICTYKVSTEVTTKFDAKDGKVIPRYGTSFDEDTGEKSTETPDHVEDRLFKPAAMGDNGDAFFCYEIVDTLKAKKAGHFIRVGRIHELEKWDMVDTRDSVSCVKGLHTGNRDYIAGYEGTGTVTHNTFVDPMDIGAITDDGSGALRVRRYYTHSSSAGINRSIYHSSKYAAMTDQEWDELRAEAIKVSEAKAEEAKSLAAETAAI